MELVLFFHLYMCSGHGAEAGPYRSSWPAHFQSFRPLCVRSITSLSAITQLPVGRAEQAQFPFPSLSFFLLFSFFLHLCAL